MESRRTRGRAELMQTVGILCAISARGTVNMQVSIRTARMSAQRRTRSQSASESWNAVHGIFLMGCPGRRMVVIGPNLRSAVLTKTLIVCAKLSECYTDCVDHLPTRVLTSRS